MKWRHDQQRTLVYVPYIFGKSGFIPRLLLFLSSLLLLLQPTPSKPNPFQPRSLKESLQITNLNKLRFNSKQAKNDHIGVRFLINIRPDVGWGFSLDFCLLFAFQESIFYSRSFSFFFFFLMSWKLDVVFQPVTTECIVLATKWHGQKQKPGWSAWNHVLNIQVSISRYLFFII